MTNGVGMESSRGMANVLSELKQEQIQALGRLGWSLRRIERELGVRRETASRYMHAAGIPVREPGSWGHRPPGAAAEPISNAAIEAISKPAIEAISTAPPRNPVQQSTCEEHREFIEAELKLGRQHG